MRKELTGALVWAGLMLALAFGGIAAHRLGYVERDTVTRVVSGVIGLWMVWYGNRIPKAFVRSDCVRRTKRVTAWSMVLSGLVYAGLWAFAPIPVATWVGMAAVMTSLLVVLGYCLSQSARPTAA